MSKFFLHDSCMRFQTNEYCVFIKYENIYILERPVLKTKDWIVRIKYLITACKETGFDVLYDTKEEAEKGYEEILEKCIQYNSANSLEQKLDKLLSVIEVLPGGGEYEKTKKDFEKNE